MEKKGKFFLTEEFQLIHVKGLRETENHGENTKVINYCAIKYKGKNSKLPGKKPGRHLRS